MPFKLGDLLDPEKAQQLQDAFAAVVPVTTVLLDSRGVPFTKASNVAAACKKLRGTKAGMARCAAAQREMLEAAMARRSAVAVTCPEVGRRMAAVPILLDGQPLACWVVSLDDDEDLSGIPFEQVLRFLKSLGDVVISLARARHEMYRKNEELRAASLEVRSTADMLRAFVDSSDISIYASDFETGEMLLVNEHCARSFGLKAEDMVGRKCWQAGGQQADTFCSFCPREKLLDEKGVPLPPVHWENHNPVTGRWLRLTNQAIPWPDGRMAHMVTFLDVTDEHKMRDELSRLAYYDQTMKLPNVLKLQQDLAGEHDRSGQILVCFDIAKLRSVNEAYGRETGDALLDAVAQWAQAQNFGQAEFYRLMGDEFCLYFKQADRDKAAAVAGAIQGRFAEMWDLEPQDRRVQVLSGVSVAVVSILPDTDVENIITLIERTLSAAREIGGPAVYNEEMDRHAKEHLRLEMSLKHCVKNDMQGFDVHYQAIVDPAAGTWKGLEALCRWESPDVGHVPPLVFIKEAEQLGLIRKVGMWVLERSVATCKELGLDAVDGFFVSVNLSLTQLLDEQFVQSVLALLQKYRFPGGNLILEVTESTEMLYSGRVRDACDKLRFHGVRFSLDDFGTGYSSFNNLKALPVSKLKTEREFIEGIEDDQFMQYFYYTLTELAHAADMKLIAEGVETREQLLIMLNNGVDYLQGYYFSKPLPAEKLKKELYRFTQVDRAFYAAQDTNFSIDQIFSGQNAWLNSPQLFTVLNQSMHILLTEADMGAAFELVLAKVGQYFKVSRSYVFLLMKDGRYANTQEWRAPGAPPQKRNLRAMGGDSLRTAWLDALMNDGMLVASDVDKLPRAVRDGLDKQRIKSVAVVPMMDEGQVVGFMGLDNLRYREWLPEEIVMLRNLAMTMGGSLKRERLQAELRQNDVRFTDVMNHIGQAIMVTDLATNEILWANDTMKTLHQADAPLEGAICYEAIQGLDARCDFCQIPRLLENPDTRETTWECPHPRSGRTFMVTDSLVQWGGGRRVHLQYAIDITEVKQAQQQLEYFASTDTLTGAVNRSSLIAALRRELQAANETGKPLSVVFVDIDRLKYANDTFGHSVGDELIKSTVDSLRLGVRSSDLIGRYGGDEFLVLMPGCGAERARVRVEEARALMGRQSFGPMGDGFSFSYGIVESTELPWQEGDRILNAIVNLADDRMRDYKKTYKAQTHLEDEAPAAETPAGMESFLSPDGLPPDDKAPAGK